VLSRGLGVKTFEPQRTGYSDFLNDDETHLSQRPPATGWAGPHPLTASSTHRTYGVRWSLAPRLFVQRHGRDCCASGTFVDSKGLRLSVHSMYPSTSRARQPSSAPGCGLAVDTVASFVPGMSLSLVQALLNDRVRPLYSKGYAVVDERGNPELIAVTGQVFKA